MRKGRRLLAAALAAVLAISAGWLAAYRRDVVLERQAQEAARDVLMSAGEISHEPEIPLAPGPAEETPPAEQAPLEDAALYLWEADLAALREINPDVTGWISIPGTQVDYPIVQAADNRYYLSRTWQKQKNAAGSIFLEQTASPDFGDFNTIVYGHNMKSGSMFGSLRKYRTQSHYEANPCIYIADDSGIRRYEIFAAFEAEVTGYTYRLDLNTPEKREEFLRYGLARSVLETELSPGPEDRILTLSTCTGGEDVRWVVQGVLTGHFTERSSAAPEAAR